MEIAVIRDSLHTMDGKVSWVPHEKNCVDCLTKIKGNAEALLTLMKKAKYRLVAEKDEMAARAEFREKTGKLNPRAKRSGVAYEHPPSPYAPMEEENYVSHAPPEVRQGILTNYATFADASSRNVPSPSSPVSGSFAKSTPTNFQGSTRIA